MKLDLQSYRLFLVDMDDTLYEERDFVLSGFRAVAVMLGEQGFDCEGVWHCLVKQFQAHGRQRIFDHLLSVLQIDGVGDHDFIAECVRVYREHDPQIALYTGVADVLSSLRSLGTVVIVTDGLPSVQKQKFAALGLDKLSDQLVCCWELDAPKPDPKSLSGWVAQGQTDAVFIGDDPVRDLPLAAALGIPVIRIRTGRFCEMQSPYPPLAELNTFAELLGSE